MSNKPTTNDIIDQINELIYSDKYDEAEVISQLFYDTRPDITDFNERIAQKLPIPFRLAAKNSVVSLNTHQLMKNLGYIEDDTFYFHSSVKHCLRNLSNAKYAPIVREIAIAYIAKHDIQEIMTYEAILQKLIGDLK